MFQTLATAQGNILENRELIDSLKKTKASSALIQESLLESHRLQTCLDQVTSIIILLTPRIIHLYMQKECGFYMSLYLIMTFSCPICEYSHKYGHIAFKKTDYL